MCLLLLLFMVDSLSYPTLCEGNTFMFNLMSILWCTSLDNYASITISKYYFSYHVLGVSFPYDLFILWYNPSLIFCHSVSESNCQMRTLDSGIGTFPLPDSGNRSMGRYLCQPDSAEDTEPLLSLQPSPPAACSIRVQTLERQVPSSTQSQLSAESAIAHSTSDPIMLARGAQPLHSCLPKPASSGKMPIALPTRWLYYW